ncbi:unnamed protein product [Owenia fusiformis]|uniref:Uncharacterized protein n=1 Tax=Owenia fusiformis TaxID=6347 RepID=A0A8J1U448_OWEFU|nr:unnamed protein product [Owenia fusiformis]
MQLLAVLICVALAWTNKVYGDLDFTLLAGLDGEQDPQSQQENERILQSFNETGLEDDDSFWKNNPNLEVKACSAPVGIREGVSGRQKKALAAPKPLVCLANYGRWCGAKNTKIGSNGCSCKTGINTCSKLYPPIDALDKACMYHDFCVQCAAIYPTTTLHWCHCERNLYYQAQAATCKFFDWKCKSYRAAVMALFKNIPCKCNKKILPCGIKYCTKKIKFPCGVTICYKTIKFPCIKWCWKYIWGKWIKFPCGVTTCTKTIKWLCTKYCYKTIKFPCGIKLCYKMITVPNFSFC